jgi:hypothetical protein
MVAYHSTCEQCIPDAKAYNNGGSSEMCWKLLSWCNGSVKTLQIHRDGFVSFLVLISHHSNLLEWCIYFWTFLNTINTIVFLVKHASNWKGTKTLIYNRKMTNTFTCAITIMQISSFVRMLTFWKVKTFRYENKPTINVKVSGLCHVPHFQSMQYWFHLKNKLEFYNYNKCNSFWKKIAYEINFMYSKVHFHLVLATESWPSLQEAN